MKAFYDNRRKNLRRLQKLIQNKPQTLPEGCKVKLDIEVLKGGIDYDRKTEKWKQWIENHQDDTFTVEYESRFGNEPSTVVLKEDDTDPKWLWWVGELIAI